MLMHPKSMAKGSLASRIVLQVDQTKLADQTFLWNHGQRRQDASLDRHLHLCAGRDRAQGIEIGD